MADLFWLSDEQWAVIEPFMPKDQPGPERKDDRQIISGILHVLTSGCRWRDCPVAYGPRTTVYNRFGQDRRSGGHVAGVAGRQQQDARATEDIGERVDLGSLAAARRADSLRRRPPLPPWAERWART